MGFLRRVSGLSLRDRVTSLVIREGLGVEPLLLCIERSQMRWLRHLVGMPPGHLSSEVFWAHLTGRRPRTRWRDYVSRLAWEWPGTGTSGFLCSNCCPRDPIPGEAVDGWVVKTYVY